MGARSFFESVFKENENSRLLVKHLNVLTAQQQDLKKLLLERCNLIYRISDEIAQLQKLTGVLANKEMEVLLEICKSYHMMALTDNSFVAQISGESKVSELLQQVDLYQLQEKVLQEKLNVDLSNLQKQIETYDRLEWRLKNAIDQYDHRVELMKQECEKMLASGKDQALLHHAENFFSIKDKLFPIEISDQDLVQSPNP